MSTPNTPTVSPGQQLPAAAPSGQTALPDDRAQGALVPIRSMGVQHVPEMKAHLLALSPQDRYLRFGYAATDEHILKYVGQLNFDRDELLGIFNRKLELIAMAHLAFSVDPNFTSCAEFGVSVAQSARARGYGSMLFERATMHARNEGVNQLFIHALSENTAMLKIARKAGARIERDGSETEAHLVLPPASFDSRVVEIFNEHVAITDYHLKARANRFWAMLSLMQGVRSESKSPEISP
ncbi:MAG: GNAT family N-acetyltransferase [Hydrogenophaga sp.]